MKFIILLGLSVLGLASCNTRVPTFTWVHDQVSPKGVPLLSIDFHDGNPVDVAVLEQFNPIPKQPSETEESIDKCIFRGHLRGEPNVYLVLTGGCPFEDSFEIQFLSKRSKNSMFKVERGVATVVPSSYQSNGLVRDIALYPPALKKSVIRSNEAPANEYVMKVALNYDASFGEQFGDDGFNVMRRSAAHAEVLYQHPTLGYPIFWEISGNLGIPETIDANENDLNYVGRYNDPSVNSNAYFCYQNGESGTVGIAWIGTICGPQDYQTAVVEYFGNDITTGEILAHEIGHNLGMLHDFDGAPGNPRYDSQGNICTGIGGVMDYYGEVFQWSTCSVEDFNGTPHSCLGSP